jgi:hypothetical protein
MNVHFLLILTYNKLLVEYFFYSLEIINVCVWMCVYVVHFNLQFNATSPKNLYNKFGTGLLY